MAAKEATGEAPAETSALGETAATLRPPTPARQGQSGVVAKEVIQAAVAKATGLPGDRLAMLHGAVGGGPAHR